MAWGGFSRLICNSVLEDDLNFGWELLWNSTMYWNRSSLLRSKWEITETFRCDKTSWNDNVSRSREFWDLRLKTKSWNFEEGRRRPKSPKESLKKALSSIELSCNQLSLFAYFRKNVRKARASCLVDVETEHELKAVRKRVTFFLSDDPAESFLFSLCF